MQTIALLFEYVNESLVTVTKEFFKSFGINKPAKISHFIYFIRGRAQYVPVGFRSGVSASDG
jgi:hypothetical protein